LSDEARNVILIIICSIKLEFDKCYNRLELLKFSFIFKAIYQLRMQKSLIYENEKNRDRYKINVLKRGED